MREALMPDEFLEADAPVEQGVDAEPLLFSLKYVTELREKLVVVTAERDALARQLAKRKVEE
jgi:hypothetical protein